MGELEAYGHGLDQRPRLVVLNKIELLDSQALKELQSELAGLSGRDVLLISAAAAQGLETLLAAVWGELGIQSS